MNGPKAVVLMRPAPLTGNRGQDLRNELELTGYRVMECATTRHVPLITPGPDFDADAFLFSSATALEALALAGQDLDLSLPVLAVGRQTAIAARKFGFSDIRSGDGGLSDLMAAFPGFGFDKLLYVGANRPRHNPAHSGFQENHPAGPEIRHWPVYRTCDSDPRDIMAQFSSHIRSNLFQIVYLSFFSRRNAASFARTMEKAGPVAGVHPDDFAVTCYSGEIADCLRHLPFKSVEIAEQPNRKSYLSLMAGLLAG